MQRKSPRVSGHSLFIPPKLTLRINDDVQPFSNFATVTVPEEFIQAAKNGRGDDLSLLRDVIGSNPDLTTAQLQQIYVHLWNFRQDWARIITTPHHRIEKYLALLPKDKLLPVLTEQGPIRQHVETIFYAYQYGRFSAGSFVAIFNMLPNDKETRSAFVNSFPNMPQMNEDDWYGKEDRNSTKLIYAEYLQSKVQKQLSTFKSRLGF